MIPNHINNNLKGVSISFNILDVKLKIVINKYLVVKYVFDPGKHIIYYFMILFKLTIKIAYIVFLL